VWGRLAAWMCGVPAITTEHNIDSWKSGRRLAVDRRLLPITGAFVAVSDAVRADLLCLGVGRPEQVLVVPLGLDVDPFLRCEEARGELRAELGVGDAPLVGIVARLVPIKRHEDFLSAAAVVASRLPQCRFLVVGGGELRRTLEGRARALGLDGRVRFLGWRGDLPRIYADLDLVVLTSGNEGLPVSLIEAMAAARAVVATRVGGVPDLVEDGVTGLLVPPGEPPALAEAIATLLADPELRRVMGEAGRKRVHPAYSVERLVRDIDRLYSDLVAEKLGRRP